MNSRPFLHFAGALVLLLLNTLGTPALAAPDRLTLTDCARFRHTRDFKTWMPKLRVFPAREPKGIALVIHGLTVRPSSYDQLAGELEASGVTTITAGLMGHNEDDPLGSYAAATHDHWINQVVTAYCGVRERADREGIPLYLIGHSVGGLLVQELLNSKWNFPRFREPIRADRVVLLAPMVTGWEDASWSFVGRMAWGMIGQTVGPRPPLSRYFMGNDPADKMFAMFEEMKFLRQIRYRESNLPTLLLLHSKDAVVDYEGYQAAKREFGLDQWEIERIDTPENAGDAFNPHLIVDRFTSGRAWDRELRLIRQFLGI